MSIVVDPQSRPWLYPSAQPTTPEVGDYVKVVALMPGGMTAGVWYRVTGRCRDGRFRGRGASAIVSSGDEIRFSPHHVVERRSPRRWQDRLLAWWLQRNASEC